MGQTMKRMSMLLVALSGAVILLGGCSKSSSPLGNANSGVSMSVAFSKAGAAAGLYKLSGIAAVDSLRIDSAIVILQRITFESNIDTVVADSTGMRGERDDEVAFTFKGPFVIHVRDTVAINFASQTLPAGTYNGIKFKIHRITPGEAHEDSDDRNNHPHGVNDTTFANQSIMVWGSIHKNGSWVPFAFRFNDEIEFKLKGTFTVASATNNIKMALNFNMGLWFKNPGTGALLDPTDTSQPNRELLREAIKRAFEGGRGGHDRGDGHPD